MLLEINDWIFDIDMPATMEYSASEAKDHCTCAYCRNFYAAADTAFPNLRPFMAQFGIDMEGPDELMPYTSTDIQVLYAVSGRIVKQGKDSFSVDGILIRPEAAPVFSINTSCPEPYFILDMDPFEIPWVLDEPMEEEEIVSPANQPSFLKKMMDALLRRAPKGQTPS